MTDSQLLFVVVVVRMRRCGRFVDAQKQQDGSAFLQHHLARDDPLFFSSSVESYQTLDVMVNILMNGRIFVVVVVGRFAGDDDD
jgi:hypothetical protein